MRIISNQLDIKLGQFTQEELDSVLRNIDKRKAAELDEITPEVWKTWKFDYILLQQCNAVFNQNSIHKWTKRCVRPFLKKGDLGIAKNYRGITLTSTVTKIYSAQNPKLRRYFGNTKMAFGEIDPRHHKFSLLIEFLKG